MDDPNLATPVSHVQNQFTTAGQLLWEVETAMGLAVMSWLVVCRVPAGTCLVPVS